ncbi:MAG: hypothetical protein ACFCUS_12120 [Rubrimonas sp.]|uniref:hypothetical protein n=1 Tax=Rubrimonas sp. TaxID=2036015 RepID=UPI002FDE22F1
MSIRTSRTFRRATVVAFDLAPRITTRSAARAEQAARVIAAALAMGELAVGYRDLAERLELPNRTGRGQRGLLDALSLLCQREGWPDLATVVVTAGSLRAGRPRPSRGVFDASGVWPTNGLTEETIPLEQSRARDFDWRATGLLDEGG